MFRSPGLIKYRAGVSMTMIGGVARKPRLPGTALYTPHHPNNTMRGVRGARDRWVTIAAPLVEPGSVYCMPKEQTSCLTDLSSPHTTMGEYSPTC